MRVYNRFRQCERTRQYTLKGTFLRMDGCLALIQLDGREYISHCTPSDYAIEHDNQRFETINLAAHIKEMQS